MMKGREETAVPVGTEEVGVGREDEESVTPNTLDGKETKTEVVVEGATARREQREQVDSADFLSDEKGSFTLDVFSQKSIDELVDMFLVNKYGRTDGNIELKESERRYVESLKKLINEEGQERVEELLQESKGLAEGMLLKVGVQKKIDNKLDFVQSLALKANETEGYNKDMPEADQRHVVWEGSNIAKKQAGKELLNLLKAEIGEADSAGNTRAVIEKLIDNSDLERDALTTLELESNLVAVLKEKIFLNADFSKIGELILVAILKKAK